MMNWGCFNGFGFMHGGWGLFLGFGGLILLAVVIFAIFKSTNRSNHHSSNADALDVLNARYARGEIDEEEYLRRKDLLNR